MKNMFVECLQKKNAPMPENEKKNHKQARNGENKLTIESVKQPSGNSRAQFVYTLCFCSAFAVRIHHVRVRIVQTLYTFCGIYQNSPKWSYQAIVRFMFRHCIATDECVWNALYCLSRLFKFGRAFQSIFGLQFEHSLNTQWLDYELF